MCKYLLTACLLASPLTANSALLERLGGLAYYDDVADLTWLADANYAQTSGYDSDGKMAWVAANIWAAQLTVDGIGGWRLPDTIDVGNDGVTYGNIFEGVDAGYNITVHSELSNMFHNVLVNTSIYDTSGLLAGCNGYVAPNYCLTNTGPFSNVQPYHYWSATEYAPGGFAAWRFDMRDGFQGERLKSNDFYGWAVQSGDVGAVPIPSAVWLFGSGLLGLIGLARRKT